MKIKEPTSDKAIKYFITSVFCSPIVPKKGYAYKKKENAL